MSRFKTSLAIAVFLGQFVSSAGNVCAQAPRALRDRIPKADPHKYDSVREAHDWKNPYLIVRPDGVEMVGITGARQTIAVESVPAALEKLPVSAWPYGLVVAVQDVGIVGGATDETRIKANRAQLLKLLKELDVTVDPWPS